MKYIMCWTMKRSEYDFEDAYIVCENLELAQAEYDHLCKTEEQLHCAAISKVVRATEPHWEE